MGTRDEQKEQRRRKIISGAVELFVKKGYADTKISDIAKAADMSVGLLFHYFESKEKLLEELVRMGVEFSSHPKQMTVPGPLDYFRMSAQGIFMAAKADPFVLNMFVLMGRVRSGDGVPAHIRELAMTVDQVEFSAEVVAAGQKMGTIREGDPKLMAFTFWSAVQGVMEQIALEPEHFAGEYPDPEWLVAILKK